MHIEWVKLKAVAAHLNCSELTAREKLDAGTAQVFTAEELDGMNAFLERAKIRPLDRNVFKTITYGENSFLFWEKH